MAPVRPGSAGPLADAVTVRPSGTLIGLGAVLVAAVGTATAVVVSPADPPAALETATATTTVGVTEREDADDRQVQVVLDIGAPRVVATVRTGTVTASACSASEPLRSGDVVAWIDGQPVTALASEVPLWRDLALDDRGDDVRGVQRALRGLGWPLAVDGVVGRATLMAAQQFLVEHGLPRDALPTDAVPRDAFAWVPDTENTVQACTAVVGAPVPTEGTLAELPADLRGARVESLPLDPAPGGRKLRFEGVGVEVDERGVVVGAGSLATIAALPQYAATVAAADGPATLTATWSLREPRRVQVVPPTALFDLRDGHGCLQRPDGRAVDVEVLGSELGQSFVRSPGDRPVDRVRARPDRSRSCR
jgi:peptidoglycan hydrolase-like protein with peptidoglycan-binding domain